MGRVKFIVERSKSRRGGHAERKIALIVSPSGVVEEPKPRRRRSVAPVYSRGSAEEWEVDVPEGYYAVQVRLVRNTRGHVKGYIEVYDSEGRLVYRAVYRRLKLRYSKGDPTHAWVVEKVAQYLKLPVKRVNLVPAWLRGR